MTMPDRSVSSTSPTRTQQALALYVLLVCASAAQGLSYYSGPRIAELLRLEPEVVAGARRELIELGLIAYQKPLYQLLSLERELPEIKSQPTQRTSSASEPQPVGLLAHLSQLEGSATREGAPEVHRDQKVCTTGAMF
jgi:hypothetical protein